MAIAIASIWSVCCVLFKRNPSSSAGSTLFILTAAAAALRDVCRHLGIDMQKRDLYPVNPFRSKQVKMHYCSRQLL